MENILLRAKARRERALKVTQTLGLLERWSRFGSPVVVGSVRHDLVVELDIDMEIYADNPGIEPGFEIMSEIARLPGVWKIRFSNELTTPNQGLYWQIRYRDHVDDVWKVDCWLLANDHPHAHWAEKFADAMQQALTDQTRRTILEIKEALKGKPGINGINIYKAVLEDGVRHPTEFTQWLAEHQPSGLTFWLPSG